MSEFNAYDIALDIMTTQQSMLKNKIGDASPEEMDEIFADLRDELSPTQYKAVIDAVGKFLEEGNPDLLVDFGHHKEGARKILEQIENRLQNASTENLQGLAQIFLIVAREKGDKAGPLTKAFTDAAAKMTDAEYNDKQHLVQIQMNWIKSTVAAAGFDVAPRPNPFRP